MKSEKRFYCDERGEYRSYAIYDCSKVDKTKEDFWDNVEGVYDIIAYEEYLEENDCMLISNEVEHKLNEQQGHISYWKHKVNGLLWILSQFDEEKVKELLKELENE